jgi:transcriptional regulator with XRE-family HTH domain
MSYSMSSRNQPIKRKRGIVLSARGWQRLQAAEQRAVSQSNYGKPYTLQELSDRTGLSPNTLARVRSRKVAVDQQTLENYFRAFDLVLGPEDYTDSESAGSHTRQQVLLSGQLPIDSPFYVHRPPSETICAEALQQPGALIRVKAPRQMGKSSLVARALYQAREQRCATAMLSLQLADTEVFTDLKRFLQWFCAVVTQNLGLPNQLEKHWDDLFGNSYNCTNYFENYILAELDSPLVLALDEVDVIFEYPAIAADFFGMLRAWYERSRYGDSKSDLWQKLRIVLIHSTEVYVPLNLHQSPFNAGLAIDLPTFTQEQIQDLAQRYGIESQEECVEEVIKLTGGIPYLVQVALHHLAWQEESLKDLISNASALDGVYGGHLRNLLSDLSQYPDLVAALKQVINSSEPTEVDTMQAFKLQSKGLVKIRNQQVVPSCTLYQSYFKQVLS